MPLLFAVFTATALGTRDPGATTMMHVPLIKPAAIKLPAGRKLTACPDAVLNSPAWQD